MNATKLPRGIFEKVPGSKHYWIRYADISGRLHRESAGTLGNAKKLLNDRRNDKLRGKLPTPSRPKPEFLFSDLIDAALRYAVA